MPKGKRGPRPEVQPDAPTEAPDNDPSIEEIVGEENIVDVGDAPAEQQPAERQGYKCIEVGCTFQTGYLSEMEEHNAGTGHGGYATETLDPLSATQPELTVGNRIVHVNIGAKSPRGHVVYTAFVN